MYVIYYCIMLAVSTTRNAKLASNFFAIEAQQCVGAKKMTEMEVTSVVIPERESQ